MGSRFEFKKKKTLACLCEIQKQEKRNMTNALKKKNAYL